mmetsp:Transcript_12381/g.42919  ORF Transcript_12381/g.42919 Transcript_12381/m.42919 type:complete len:540 (+) Transcript_12381:442-2061(+)
MAEGPRSDGGKHPCQRRVHRRPRLRRRPDRRHLRRAGAEEERICRADGLGDLDVRAVLRAHDEAAVHDKLHVPGAARLRPRRRNVLAHVARGHDHLREAHVIVGQEDHLQQVANPRVRVHCRGDAADQVDDALRHGVPARGLAREDDGPRHHLRPLAVRRAQYDVVPVYDAQDVEELPLVLVYALHVDVEQHVRVQLHAARLAHDLRQPRLVAHLNPAPLGLERGVAGEPAELGEPVEADDPVGAAHGAADEVAQGRVRGQEPPPRAHAVRHVAEAVRVHLVEVREELRAEQTGVDLRDAVHGVRPHEAQHGHPHHLWARLLDDAHALLPLHVAGPLALHLLQVPVVDLVDDLHVPGEQPLHQGHWPTLQRLRECRVVGEADRLPRYVPRLNPRQALAVDEEAHELGDADGRVRVVELHAHLAGQLPPLPRPLLEPPQDVLQRGAHEEVLLLEPQLLAHVRVVDGVQHAADALSAPLRLDRLVEVPGVEAREVELRARAAAPQPQVVRVVRPVAGHGHVVCNRQDHLPALPPEHHVPGL